MAHRCCCFRCLALCSRCVCVVQSIEYSRVPYMPGTNVPGHSGKIYVGSLPTKHGVQSVMCFAGRVHAYEGWSGCEFNFIVRLAHACGVKVMILTNSAGGALHGMVEGSIMAINDHIRFSGINPLVDISDDPRFGTKHATSNKAYSKRIAAIVQSAAKTLKIDVLSGTYNWTSGPSYETPAEVQAGLKLSVNSLGGAFGMSTVPEVLAAHNLGMEVFAVSLCTNLAAGLSNKELTHGDVKEVAEVAGPRFQNLLLEMFKHLDVDPEAAKHVLPIGFDPSRTGADAPTKSLYTLGGWTPSAKDVYAAVQRAGLANAGLYTDLTAGVIFLGGRHQRAVQSAFVEQLTGVRSLPFRELAPVFAAHPDMMSSFARTATVLFGSVRSSGHGAPGKRVAVLLSADGNGLVGLNSAESSLFIQMLQGLGVSTILASGVGVDTQSRGIGGQKDGASSSAKKPQIVLVEDVLDRTIDPLPLSAFAGMDSMEPVRVSESTLFDGKLTLGLERALLHDSVSAQNKKQPAPTVAVGSYLSFQGPMLPTEAELNIAFHAGAVTAAGISNLQFTLVAKEFGLRVAVLLHTVAEVNSLPAVEECVRQQHAHNDKQEHTADVVLAAEISDAFVHLLVNEPVIEHIPRNVRLDAAAAALAAPASACTPRQRGFGPVAFQCVQESHATVSKAAQWILAAIGGAAELAQAKSFIFLEGMLAGALSSQAGWNASWSCNVLDVPGFATFLGVDSTKSGPAYPYDPRFLMSTWSLQFGSIDGKKLLLLTNSADRTSTVPAFHGLSYFVRVGKLLGVSNVTLVSPVGSVRAELAPGSFVAVRDHINLTGLNPLFGENEAEFGPRFNDMSVVYKPHVIEAFTAQTPAKAEPITMGVLAQVSNPQLSSPSEAALARSIHASVLTAGFAPLATIAKHADMIVSGLCCVSRTAGSSDSVSTINKAQSATAAIYQASVHGAPAHARNSRWARGTAKRVSTLFCSCCFCRSCSSAVVCLLSSTTLPSAAALATLRTLLVGAVDNLDAAGKAHSALAHAAVHVAH